jgi:glycosyltransferase involved in cell wall biosynthesis
VQHAHAEARAGDVPSHTILMASTVPLAAPWNGADKNLARTLILRDEFDRFIVQTRTGEPWPVGRVQPVMVRESGALPTTAQKARSLGFLLRWTHSSDVVHLVASMVDPPAGLGRALRVWGAVARRPIVHSLPSLGDRPVDSREFFGDATVVFSELTRDRLLHAGLSNVVRIDPPLDFEALAPREPAAEIRRRLDIEAGAILYPGHHGSGSGIPQMIEAVASLPRQFDETALVLACRAHAWQNRESEERAALRLAAAAGIGHRLRIVSEIQDMPALIEACSLTALVPETLTGKMDLPMVILESLFLGRAVVIGDYQPLREALFGGGIAVPYGDVHALRNSLARLLSDSDLRAHLGRQGHAEVIARCEPRRIVDRYREIYSECLSGPRKA